MGEGVAEWRMNSAVGYVAAAVNSRMGVRTGTGTGPGDGDRTNSLTLAESENRFMVDQSIGSVVQGAHGNNNKNSVEGIRRASIGMCLERSLISELDADSVKDSSSTVGADVTLPPHFLRLDEYLRNGSDILTQSSQKASSRKSSNPVLSTRKQLARLHPVAKDISVCCNGAHVEFGELSGPRTNSRVESDPGSGRALLTRVGREERNKEGNTRHSKSAGDFRSTVLSCLSTSISNGPEKAVSDGRYHGHILFACAANAQARDVVDILERVSTHVV